MESIKLNTGIKKYAIENENGEVVATISIDTNDTTLMSRFMELYHNLTRIGEDTKAKIENEDMGDTIDMAIAEKVLGIHAEGIKETMAEIEKIFGEGLFKNIYADNYANNPSFIPSMDAIQEFIEQIMPIVESTFKQRTSKYSATRGKK